MKHGSTLDELAKEQIVYETEHAEIVFRKSKKHPDKIILTVQDSICDPTPYYLDKEALLNWLSDKEWRKSE